MTTKNSLPEDGRIISLEEASYFQDVQLKSLESHVLAQQRRMDDLERQLASLKGAMERLREIVRGCLAEGISPTNDAPPHYLETNR